MIPQPREQSNDNRQITMHLLLITNDYPPKGGGLAAHTAGLAAGAAIQGHHVDVLATNCDHRSAVTKDDSGVQVRYLHVFGRHNFWRVPQLFFWITWYTLQLRPSVLHATTWSPHGFACALSCFFSRRRFIVSANGFDVLDSLNSFIYKRLMKFTLRRASRVITVSRYLKDRLQAEGIENRDMQVIGNGVDIERFRPLSDPDSVSDEASSRGKHHVLTVCRLVEIKGVDVLLRAVPGICRTQPDSEFLIIGAGPARSELEALAAELGISEVVHFVGAVPNEELPEMYNNCDVVVQPSREVKGRHGTLQEGLGIVFLEAAACAKPVVGTLTGGIPEIVENGKTGLLVPPEQPDQLAEAVLKLFRNPDLASQFGRNGRHLVVSNFSWPQVAQRAYSSELSKLR